MRKATLMAVVSAAALMMTSGGVFAQSGLDGAIPGSGDGQPGQTNSPQKPRDMPEAQTPPEQTITGESAASEARIRAMLEKQGYGDVQNIQKQGDAYIATATKEGERVQVRVDPQLGQIEEHGR